MSLHCTQIFDFHRSNLIFGCERNPILALGMICIVLVVLQNIITAFLAAALWLGGVPMLRIMGKSDSQMSEVFINYRKHAEFYPAHARKNYAQRD